LAGLLPGNGANEFVDVFPDARSLAQSRAVVDEDAHCGLLRLSSKSFCVNNWIDFHTLCYRGPLASAAT
jgi:hypothetical protein